VQPHQDVALLQGREELVGTVLVGRQLGGAARNLGAQLQLRLVQVGEEVLGIAVTELGRRKYWSEVASRMQQHAEAAGFSVVTQYVGHGIGRIMHENPQVRNFVSRDMRKHDFRLEEGLVLAEEPMVNMGRPEVQTLRDQWTVVTRDGLPSVHVEHTLALTKNGVAVITADEEPKL